MGDIRPLPPGERETRRSPLGIGRNPGPAGTPWQKPLYPAPLTGTQPVTHRKPLRHTLLPELHSASLPSVPVPLFQSDFAQLPIRPSFQGEDYTYLCIVVLRGGTNEECTVLG